MKQKSQLVAHVKKDQRKTHMHIVLFVLVITVLILALSSIYELNYDDKISIQKGILLFIYGMIFFTCLYNGVNNLILRTSYGQRFMKNYHLTVGDVFELSNRIVSTIQAIFCCLTGFICSWYSCRRDILKTSHFISESYSWFGAAYFFYDIWSMYRVHGAKTHDYRLSLYLQMNFIIVAHHLFIGCFGFLVITYLRGGLGDCFFGFIYLMEASTPFVSLRIMLAIMGMKNSKLYVTNGVIMLIVFFICRIIMFPAVLLLYSYTVDLDYYLAIKSLPNGCKMSILILFLPQIYWFLLMIDGASKLLKMNKTVNHHHNNINNHFYNGKRKIQKKLNG